MGRHSAPEDSDDDVAATVTDSAAPSDAPGRHSAAEGDDADNRQPESAAEPARRERATQADLRLLRTHPGLRARCIAAALTPFVIYTVVLFALASVHIYVLWLWAPIIGAGVLVGAVLDAAHKRIDTPPSVEEPAQDNDSS